MVSLFENNKDIEEIIIYLLNDDISDKNIRKIKGTCKKYGRELIVIETGVILKRLKDLGVAPFKGTYTTYFKLFAIKSLDLPTGRVLQLDGDTVINGSLKELCTLDLEECLIAATYDCTMSGYKELIGIPSTDKYYNCGVLLIDQQKWIEDNCEERIVEHLSSVRHGYYTVDQDILNVLFRKEFKYLDLKYNFNSGFYIYGIKESLNMYGLKEPYYNSVEEIEKAYKNPIIYHCMGAMTGRPWEQDSIHPQNEIYDRYLMISMWADEPKARVNRSTIFKVQRFLYSVLPRGIYIPFHKIGQKYYLDKKNKEVQVLG